MAKQRKAAAKKSTKARAKRAPAGQKRKSSRRKPQGTMSFFDHFLSLFADPGTRKK
jgi:hypothetical protein